MYEYKVVPAPVMALKVKGLKTVSERFAHTLAERINAESAGGWRFVRTESLPCEARKTLGKTRSSTETVMIFARPVQAQAASQPEAHAVYDAYEGQNVQQAASNEYRAEDASQHTHSHEAQPQWDDHASSAQASHQEYETAPTYDTAHQNEPVYAEPAPEYETPPPPPPSSTEYEQQNPVFRAGAGLRADASQPGEPRLRPLGGQTRDS